MFLKFVAHAEGGDGGLVVGAHGPDAFASMQDSRKGATFAPPPPASHPRFKQGFTLLEMLAVIVLIALVGTLVATQLTKHFDQGKWTLGQAGVQKLANEITDYQMDNGSPPKVLDDLLTKPLNAPSWNGPYAKPADLNDPFGHPYGYEYPGKHGQYDIIFYGRDGKPGGEGVDRDYGNWQ